MAGIAGEGAARLGEPMRRALASLRHRGPDGEGLQSFPGCLLGHTRLAIIDLAHGGQPMLTDDGQTCVTFNGAIYGYRELRPDLEGGYRFRTASDTEVILALYRRHGEGMLAHLPGMFAFALWDERSRTLFAARDRFGEKPLYFARGPAGELVFASAIRAILATGLVVPELDRASLGQYLHHRYLPPDRTIWRNVSVLPPAHCLSLRDGELKVRRYWDLPPQRQDVRTEEAIEELRELLTRAVEKQVVAADVPVAFFLSGGLDSSTVVALASRIRKPLTTITLDAEGSQDPPFARELSARYQTTHIEISDRGLDLGAAFLQMAEVFEEPLSDRATVSTWLVCREAREHAKVIISGEGGDELLAGYGNVYRPLEGMARWKSRPALLTSMASLAERVGNRIGLPQTLPVRRQIRGSTLARRYPSLAAAHRGQVEGFGIREIGRFGLPAPEAPAAGGGQALDSILREDVTQLLSGDWLVRTDRASMANGVELRSPMLDVNFASFCISLPERLKLGAREEKWILRRAFEDTWTPSIRRREKQGFQAADSWLERADMLPHVRRIFQDRGHPLWDLLPYDEVVKATAGKPRRRWVIFTLGLWVERWLGPRR